MLGASRTSLRELQDRLDAVFDDPTQRPFLKAAGTGVLTVLDAVDQERSLQTLWADTSTSDAVKDGVLAQVFGERIPELSQQMVQQVTHTRWSSPADMTDALERAAASLLFMSAEDDGSLDQVEEELFRFERALNASAPLQMALTDPSAPATSKAAMIGDLLDDKASPVTAELLIFLAGHLRGRKMSAGVHDLSELAAVRRNRLVAEVTSATALAAEQKERLGRALSQIHGREVLINVTVDPDVIGGITVQVGDEVIDGSIASRIEQARRRLTS